MQWGYSYEFFNDISPNWTCFSTRSQRSKECPICWQSFVLKDPARCITCLFPSLFSDSVHTCILFSLVLISRNHPANQWVWLYNIHHGSQELLDAVRIERHCRSRNTSAVATDLHHFHDSIGVEEVIYLVVLKFLVWIYA